jgi:hypothetical protein
MVVSSSQYRRQKREHLFKFFIFFSGLGSSAVGPQRGDVIFVFCIIGKHLREAILHF